MLRTSLHFFKLKSLGSPRPRSQLLLSDDGFPAVSSHGRRKKGSKLATFRVSVIIMSFCPHVNFNVNIPYVPSVDWWFLCFI
jgi:hypothetical protein